MTPSLAVPAALAWYHVGWSDWVGAVGTLLGLVGLGITFYQARQARKAAEEAVTKAEAVEKAVVGTQAQLRGNIQLVLLPALQRAAQDLDDAIERGSHTEARRSLDRWRYQASFIQGILKQEDPTPRTVIKTLQVSIALASVAGQELLDNGKPILASCKQAHGAIAKTCDDVGSIVGKNVTQVHTPSTEAQ